MSRINMPKDAPGGWRIIPMKTVDSTNTVAMELGDRDAAHGTVILADRQTKGRGRLGREWVSPTGNVFMSILLRPAVSPADAALLTMTAAVACARALRDATGLDVGIKWPNDLMVSGRKLGGILTEMKSRGRRVLFAVVGIGINLNSDAADFPPALRTVLTSLRIETGKRMRKAGLVTRILREFGFWYDELVRGGKERVLDEWKDLSFTLGRCVRVTSGNEMFEGFAETLDGEGRLIVRLVSGVEKVVGAGDVAMVRQCP
jgi:BirA family biotin operon repressor/biotin-[acetyl-CoA-carboxylase] ligase